MDNQINDLDQPSTQRTEFVAAIKDHCIPYCNCFLNTAFDESNNDTIVESTESHNVIRNDERLVTHISYRISIEPPQIDSPEAFEEALPRIPMSIDLLFRFGLTKLIGDDDTAAKAEAIRESAIRARTLASDLIYHMGGSKARDLFVQILHA